MAGKTRYLLDRDGRFFARLVIPKDLRPYMGGKSELRSALGADRRTALRNLPGAVATLQHEIALGERRAVSAGTVYATPGRYPLSNDQIALQSYKARLAQDEGGRNQSDVYGSVPIDDVYVELLRKGIAGSLPDEGLAGLVGHRIDHFVRAGNTTVVFGTDQWRALARALCRSEYAALERVAERDEGIFDGSTTDPLLVDAAPILDELPPLPIWRLFETYVASRKLIGSQRDDGNRQKSVIKSLIDFVGHDDARRLTKRNMINWRDDLMTRLVPKTVSDVYLSAVRSMLNWAIENEELSTNVMAAVRQKKPKAAPVRERGYTDPEALAVLVASRNYMPLVGVKGKVREHPATTAAKCPPSAPTEQFGLIA